MMCVPVTKTRFDCAGRYFHRYFQCRTFVFVACSVATPYCRIKSPVPETLNPKPRKVLGLDPSAYESQTSTSPTCAFNATLETRQSFEVPEVPLKYSPSQGGARLALDWSPQFEVDVSGVDMS